MLVVAKEAEYFSINITLNYQVNTRGTSKVLLSSKIYKRTSNRKNFIHQVITYFSTKSPYLVRHFSYQSMSLLIPAAYYAVFLLFDSLRRFVHCKPSRAGPRDARLSRVRPSEYSTTLGTESGNFPLKETFTHP